MKINFKIEGPILTGSISVAKSRCGKADCVCKAKKPKLHGPYYRWTGIINGKRTTKTITRETAIECEKRIARYKKALQQLDLIVANAFENAPWIDSKSKSKNQGAVMFTKIN